MAFFSPFFSPGFFFSFREFSSKCVLGKVEGGDDRGWGKGKRGKRKMAGGGERGIEMPFHFPPPLLLKRFLPQKTPSSLFQFFRFPSSPPSAFSSLVSPACLRFLILPNSSSTQTPPPPLGGEPKSHISISSTTSRKGLKVGGTPGKWNKEVPS